MINITKQFKLSKKKFVCAVLIVLVAGLIFYFSMIFTPNIGNETKTVKKITNITAKVKNDKNSTLKYSFNKQSKVLDAQMGFEDYYDITNKFADFNSDGIEDLVVVGPMGVHGFKAYIFISNTEGTLKQYCANEFIYQSDKCSYFSNVTNEDGSPSIGIRDIDGDNVPELITRNSDINGELHYNFYGWDKSSNDFRSTELKY